MKVNHRHLFGHWLCLLGFFLMIAWRDATKVFVAGAIVCVLGLICFLLGGFKTDDKQP